MEKRGEKRKVLEDDPTVAILKREGNAYKITTKDIKSLGDGYIFLKDRWLTGRTIEFMLQTTLLSDKCKLEDVMVHDTGVLHWMGKQNAVVTNKIRDGTHKNVKVDKKINIFPINKNDAHWAVVMHSRAGVWEDKDKIWVLDSMNHHGLWYLEAEVKALHAIFPSEERAEVVQCPVEQQKDSFNCGMYALCNTMDVLKGTKPTEVEHKGQSEMVEQRAIFCSQIIDFSCCQERYMNLSPVLDEMKFSRWSPWSALSFFFGELRKTIIPPRYSPVKTAKKP